MNKHIEEAIKSFNEEWPSTESYTAGKMQESLRKLLTSIYQRGREDEREEPRCPECKNVLIYFVSDDYYSKGKKFYSCEVCEWKPNQTSFSLCKNGCDGITTGCSDCPKN